MPSISAAAISSAKITEDLLTAYQKEKVAHIQYIKERFSQVKSNNFLLPCNVLLLKIFPSIKKKNNRIDISPCGKLIQISVGKMCLMAQKKRFKYGRGDKV